MIYCKNFINGNWIESSSTDLVNVINPYDQSIIAKASNANVNETKLAIEAARNAFDNGPWRNYSISERSKLLNQIADLVLENKQELATLETLDTGKTLEESRWDMDDTINVFRYYANLANQIVSQEIDNHQKNTTSKIIKEPIGVVAMICPWNYPLLQASWKIAPAIAAGCTFVLKPSEVTPVCTTRFIELVSSLNVPDGVVNLVLGTGPVVGNTLSSDPDVDLVSFTGGILTGQKILQSAALSIKKVALELGGKNPHIIFEDANYETTLDKILNGVFFHAGQICSAGSRILVHSSLEKKIVNDLKIRIQKIRLGSGQNKDTQMGPLINEQRQQIVLDAIKNAIGQGAVLECGGKKPADPKLQNGFFIEPTLFSGCKESMKIVREEIFGPVITIEPFNDDDEALELANKTDFGLSAGIQTMNQDRIERFSRELRFGTIWINDFNVYFPEAPWGGFKKSGIGRELGEEGLAEYLETKHVFTNHKPTSLNWF